MRKQAWRKRRTTTGTTRADQERAARFRQRDAAYRAALGVRDGEQLPARIGPPQPTASPIRAVSHN